MFGLLVIGGSAGAFFAPPFTGLDTLPALGGVLRSLGVLLKDFVIVIAPKPPGSSTLISPPFAVFEMAPAKVLQGAVRLHGLTSSPTPDTHVRGAWA